MTAEEAPAVPADGEVPLPEPSGRGRLVVFAVAGVLLLGALGGGAWFLAPRFFGGAKPAAAAVATVRATVPLGAVVVNLNGEARRYVRVGVSLGLSDPKHAKEVDENRSQLLDLLIAVFSTAEVEALMSEEGKAKIKDALIARMRADLRLESVARVYFTEFIIQ